LEAVVAVGVGDAVAVGVAVAVEAEVGVGVAVAVEADVGVGDAVGVSVEVGVGVGVGGGCFLKPPEREPPFPLCPGWAKPVVEVSVMPPTSAAADSIARMLRIDPYLSQSCGEDYDYLAAPLPWLAL